MNRREMLAASILGGIGTAIPLLPPGIPKEIREFYDEIPTTKQLGVARVKLRGESEFDIPLRGSSKEAVRGEANGIAFGWESDGRQAVCNTRGIDVTVEWIRALAVDSYPEGFKPEFLDSGHALMEGTWDDFEFPWWQNRHLIGKNS